MPCHTAPSSPSPAALCPRSLARGDLPAALGHLLACLGLTHESVSRGQGDDDSGGDGNGADGAAHDANLINLLEADLSLSAGLPSKTGRAAAVNPDGSVCFDAFRGTGEGRVLARAYPEPCTVGTDPEHSTSTWRNGQLRRASNFCKNRCASILGKEKKR